MLEAPNVFERLEEALQSALAGEGVEEWGELSASEKLMRASSWTLFGNRVLARSALEAHVRVHPYTTETPLALANLAQLVSPSLM
jgi:hypothetical protein